MNFCCKSMAYHNLKVPVHFWQQSVYKFSQVIFQKYINKSDYFVFIKIHCTSQAYIINIQKALIWRKSALL